MNAFITAAIITLLAIPAAFGEGFGFSNWAGWKPGQVSREDCTNPRSVQLILGCDNLDSRTQS